MKTTTDMRKIQDDNLIVRWKDSHGTIVSQRKRLPKTTKQHTKEIQKEYHRGIIFAVKLLRTKYNCTLMEAISVINKERGKDRVGFHQAGHF